MAAFTKACERITYHIHHGVEEFDRVWKDKVGRDSGLAHAVLYDVDCNTPKRITHLGAFCALTLSMEEVFLVDGQQN